MWLQCGEMVKMQKCADYVLLQKLISHGITAKSHNLIIIPILISTFKAVFSTNCVHLLSRSLLVCPACSHTRCFHFSSVWHTGIVGYVGSNGSRVCCFFFMFDNDKLHLADLWWIWIFGNKLFCMRDRE